MATEKVFHEEPELEIRDELVSMHALSPFIRECSSARCYMASSHISQSLTLVNGDEKIVQTGLEKQFGENTFSVKTDQDVRILKVIHRYTGIDVKSVNKIVETILIVENIETEEIDYISIPYYHKLHNYFGFKYIKEDSVLKTLRTSDIIPKDTILAKPPTLTNYNGYKYGVNANLCLVNIPETTEDGVVISESLAEKMSYDIFEERHIEFGTEDFPLNMYGDVNTYKPFPEIGELVNEDSVIMVLRKYDKEFSPALTSINDVREFNPIFDKAIYVKAPGSIVTDKKGNQVLSGEVVDIKVYTNPKYKKELYSGVTDGIDKYSNALKNYYQQILDAYEEIKKEHYARYRNNDVKITDKFHSLVVESLAMVNPSKKKIGYTYKNEVLDLVRVSFVIRYRMRPTVSSKLSDSYGSKGVIVQIRKDEDMPYTLINGERVVADVVMDPSSLVSRMNVGRIYEQYFNAMSRKTQFEIKQAMGGVKPIEQYTDKNIKDGWEVLLGLYELIGTEQYISYSQVKDIQTMREILRECIEEEVYILYRVSSPKRAYQIVLDSKGTIYEPTVTKAYIQSPDGKVKETKSNVMIAPVYTILLNKTGDSFLSVAGAKLNHFGFPIGVGSATRNYLPWRSSPTKILSETETRLYNSYVSRKAIAELKSRANDINVHESIYKNILDSDVPTNIDTVYDRKEHGYGEDSAMELINNIFNCAGIEIVTCPTNK